MTFKTPKIEDGKKQRLDTGIQHFIGTDPSGTRLVSYSAAVDIEEELSVRLAMLRKFPSVNLFGDISDAHLYIFKRWVINYIADNDGLSSLQGEVIPLLVKAQFRDVLGTTEGPYARTRGAIFWVIIAILLSFVDFIAFLGNFIAFLWYFFAFSTFLVFN